MGEREIQRERERESYNEREREGREIQLVILLVKKGYGLVSA